MDYCSVDITSSGDAEERFFDCASRPEIDTTDPRERIKRRDAPLRMTILAGRTLNKHGSTAQNEYVKRVVRCLNFLL